LPNEKDLKGGDEPNENEKEIEEEVDDKHGQKALQEGRDLKVSHFPKRPVHRKREDEKKKEEGKKVQFCWPPEYI
jgi:hypothetical protein